MEMARSVKLFGAIWMVLLLCPMVFTSPRISAALTDTTGLSIARRFLAGAGSGDVLIFGGGVNENGTVARADLYKLGTGNWSSTELSVDREQLDSIGFKGEILFAGMHLLFDFFCQTETYYC